MSITKQLENIGELLRTMGKDDDADLIYALAEHQPQPAGKESAQPIELRNVAEILAEKDGFWRPCTGCHELNEGHDTGDYSSVFRCAMGMGCRECGGIGVVWDNTDYAAMGKALSEAQPAPAQAEQDQHEWSRGYYCAVAVLLRDEGGVTRQIYELFNQGGEAKHADADDVALFQEHGLPSPPLREQEDKWKK